MDRALRLIGFWNWLPAFRAVAETEHLPSAARLLHVTPSALSRSVRQLEDALGQRLFARGGRRLQLTPGGRELLAAVRDTMRGLDDGLARVTGAAAVAEPVRVAVATPWLSVVVLPAMAGAPLRHCEVSSAEGPALLLRGEIDVVIGTASGIDDRLVVEYLGEVPTALAQARRSRLTRLALVERTFAVWTGGDDGWPIERPRKIAFSSPHLGAVLEVCAAGHHVAVVPVVLARAHGLAIASVPGLAPTRLHVLWRRPLAPGAVDAFVARLKETASARLVTARRTARARPASSPPGRSRRRSTVRAATPA